MKYLEIRDLRLSRGGFNLEISLFLDRGQTGVILGPSGCGKTSLLRCIAGLEQPQSGSISVNGIDIDGLAPEKRKLGFVFQDLALFDHLDGRGNLEFGLRLAGVDKDRRKEICETLAETLRIAPLLDRKPGTMSGGEKQRLAFARALATKPEILLLDEPLSSLDAPLRKELRRYLRTMLRQEGITALHVTHDVEEALDLGDRIFIMNKGRLVAQGSPSVIFKNPPDAWCVNFLGLGLLLPIEGLSNGDPPRMYNTPYGKFSPPGTIPSFKKESELHDMFYFIPPGAVFYDASRGIRENSGVETENNMLFGIVEKISQRNGLYHIRLRLQSLRLQSKKIDTSPSFEPEPKHKVLEGAEIPGEEEPYIEFDSAERPSLEEGGQGYFKIRPSECALLPGAAT